MRNIGIKYIGIACALLVLLGGCGTSSESKVTYPVISELGDDELYAFVEIGLKEPVLLTTSASYEDGNEKQASVFCDVYYAEKGEAGEVGSIESDGTAYPLRFSPDGIYAAGGHRMELYSVDEKENTLVLAEGFYETFDENGDAAYTHVSGSKEEEISEEEYLTLTSEALQKSQIIHFAYGASDGCWNEYIEH
jgi:hypothetical protein